MDDDGEAIFHEEQRFRQPWFVGLLVAVCVFWVVLAVCVIPHTVVGGIFMVLAFAPAPVVLIAVVGWAKLVTEVRPDGLHVRFAVLSIATDHFAPDDIESFDQRQYQPLRQYGGWGVRFTHNGRAYNVRGNRGVRVNLTDGHHILIGSQRPDELAAAIQSIMT